MQQHTLLRRRKREKHNLSVSEILKNKNKERITKKARHNRVPLEGFEIVHSGRFIWMGSDTGGGGNRSKAHTIQG